MIVIIIGKDPDDGKDCQQNEMGATEDEIVRQHQLNGHEFEQIPGDGEGKRGLVCHSRWDRRVRHDLATEQQQQQ